MASRRGPLAALFLTVFLDLLGFGMIIPNLALYARDFHVSDSSVMTLNSIYSLMQLVFAPIWGRISDRYGRRPVLLVSIAGSCLSQLGYALSTSFTALLAARALAGICGANIAAAQAYIADSTDEKDRAASMGLMGMAFGLGFIFGPAFGGLLVGYGRNVPFFAASALAGVNFVLAAYTLREPRSAGERTASRGLSWESLVRTVTSPRSALAIGLFFLVTFAFSQLESTFPLHLADVFGFGPKQVGWVFTGIGVVQVAVQGGLVRRLVPRFGERWLVIVGTGAMALGMLVTAYTASVGVLALACVFVAGGSAMNQPSLSSLISRSASGDRQGGVLGVAQSVSALARVLGPKAGGYLRLFGTSMPYVCGAAIMAACTVYALLLIEQPESLDALSKRQSIE